MAAKQRLTLASMWAFEDIGVQEILNEFRGTIPQSDCLCEYSKPDDVLVVKGNIENATSKIASAVSAFIEVQKNKDLLDMPRIRQLEVPAAFHEEADSATITLNENQEGYLLALDDGSDEELIPHSSRRTTKSWISSNGGLGCFATSFHDILLGISAVTGTDITIIDDTQGIQVSGGSAGDVDDALAKLSRLEEPLSYLLSPRVSNIMIAPGDKATRFRIQNYSNLNTIALRRILTDPNMISNINLGQMFVTVFLSFEDETQSFSVPGNLLNPPRINHEPGKSRIWSDFTFQEIGKGDDFLTMESIVEKDPTQPQPMASGIASTHPFLTAEKAQQVNQWVVERAELETSEPEVESCAVQPRPRETEPASDIRRPPGIKVRRAVPIARKESISQPVVEPRPAQALTIEPTVEVSPPRKRWKMLYELSPNKADSREKDESLAGDLGSGDIVVLTGNDLQLTTPRTPDNKVRLPATFDAGKYRLSKSPINTANDTRKAPKLHRAPPTASKRLGKYNELVDVFAPEIITDTSSLAQISFYQPALLPENSPQKSVSIPNGCFLQEKPSLNAGGSSVDLLGLEFGNGITLSESCSAESVFDGTKSLNDENLEEQGKRLSFLKNILQEQQKEVAASARNIPNHHKSRREINKMLVKERLTELERIHKTDEHQSTDETASRSYHRTMNHKTAKPIGKSKGKAKSKAKRQATLEDAWGIPKQPTKKPPNELAEKLTSAGQPSEGNELKSLDSAGQDADTMKLYEALKPILEASECFPGALSLEFQIGLILIPLLPKTYGEGLVSFNEWTKIFQPRTGLAGPTTIFINRLTTSGTDVDHVVDLKTSKSEGKRRIFEQEYSEYSVFYEYHCRTKANQLRIITVDEQGKFVIKKPTSTLGAVNLHFPRQTWDASVVISGITEGVTDIDPEFEEAAKHLVDNIWVQPDKQLRSIFTRLPLGNKIVIEKVFMKRWTRHRYIRLPSDIYLEGTNTRNGKHSGAAAEGESDTKSESTNKDQDSTSTKNEIWGGQDIFLQIMEVQDLFIGSSPSDPQAVRARCAPPAEMHKKGRQWYEVSLISPAIEAILKESAKTEVGDCTDDWHSSDLLGRDASLLFENATDSSGQSLSPVAAAIGVAGLGDLLRLTKTVVEKIDGIGFYNYGPGPDAIRMAAVGLLPVPSAIPGRPAASSAGPVVKFEPKSMEFDDLESIKEAGSVLMNAIAKKTSSLSSAKGIEKIELDYW